MKRISRHMTYANVMASIAVFLALGGGSFAVASHLKVRASDIQKNAVRSKHIKNQQVRTADVKNDNLRGVDVLDGTIEAIDVAFGTLRGDEIQDGSLSGADVAGNSLTGHDIDESSLGMVRAAHHADRLGGIAASGYQRRCNAGSIKGYARVRGASDYGGGDWKVTSAGFNCANGDVSALRVSTGVYRVRFQSLDPILAVGSVDATSDGGSAVDDFVTVSSVSAGEILVNVRDADGGWKDSTFTLVVVR